MKTDAITKCYGALSLKARAGLAFGYCAKSNELEATRITSTVPTATFTSVAAEYREWFEAYTRLTAWWGIEHWKIMARRMAALGGKMVAAEWAEGGNPMPGEPFTLAAKTWESRLMALDVALNEAGAAHGFDPDAARFVAGAEPFTPVLIENPEPDDVTAAKETVARILAGEG